MIIEKCIRATIAHTWLIILTPFPFQKGFIYTTSKKWKKNESTAQVMKVLDLTSPLFLIKKNKGYPFQDIFFT